jgi:transcriptional regulator with XRE-family HTH domain
VEQEKIGKLIKELRTKNNLTQAEFAKKYGVSFQAVSKWENSKNLPDMLLLKKICSDFNVNIDDVLEGKISDKKRKKKLKLFYILGGIVLGVLIFLEIFYLTNNKNSFEFNTISSNCDNFKINGSIAYDQNKTFIYISKVEYCGKSDNEVYKSIDCNLYEKNNNLESIVASCSYEENQNIKLEDYLKGVSINISNYQRVCKTYSDDSLYLKIDAINSDDKTISFNIPLSIDKCD